MFNRFCSDFATLSTGGRFGSFVFRLGEDGQFMALVKWQAADLKPMVVYGVSDNPDTAVERAIQAVRNPKRWRADKLEGRV